MLCCVSRKASARPNSETNEKHQKPIDSDCTGSTSGFSESSSASSGDFASSGFTATSSSSCSSSGFSSASPASICAFGNTSTESSSSGLEFSDRFDVCNDYLGNSSRITTEFNARGSSSFYSPVKGFPPIPPKRLQTFSPSASAQNRSNSDGSGESFVEKDKSAEDEPPVLLPCAICERTFKPESLDKHTRICERSALKKRKPFDSAKQRIQGTELAEFLPKETVKRKVYVEEKPVIAAASKTTWKQTHDEFVKTIRAARGETTDAPTQRQSVAPSQVTVGVPTRPNEKGMCPTCNRQFSIKAYERHVAWCKEHATRVPIIPTTNIAKERLEARMKYRAPMLKNRRITNREKYAPGSAANLSNFANKNSVGNQRTKESVSTPNCNNKSGNETATGASSQSHQKSTSNSRRSGQGREGMPSGPMKSRLSDRSNRPAAEIESGPTTITSSSPIPPRINIHRHSRLSPTRAILPSVTTSPLPTSRSFSKSKSIRMSFQDGGSLQKNIVHDRRPIELNILNAKRYRVNLVSARSCGNPKINDVAINNEVIGMTVERCGHHENDARNDRSLVTWKQISEDKNFGKETKFLSPNDDENLEKSVEKIGVPELQPIAENELNCNLKSRIFLPNSVNRGTKNVNQMCLIRESLNEAKNLSKILDRRMRRSVNKSSRTEFCYDEGKARKNSAMDVDSDTISLSRFNADVDVTSSPLHSRGKNKDHCEENNSGIMSPLLSGQGKLLVPLDLKMIHDEDSDFEDTSRSGRSTAFSIVTCRTKKAPKLKSINDGEELIRKDLLNSSNFADENCEILKDCRHSFEGFDDIGFAANTGNNELSENSRSVKNTENSKDNRDRQSTKKTPKMKSMRREELDVERLLNFRSHNEENAGKKNYDESIEIKVEEKNSIGENNRLSDTSRSMELKTKNWNDLDDDEPLSFRFYDEENRRKEKWKNIENCEEKIIYDEDNRLLDTIDERLLAEKASKIKPITRDEKKRSDESIKNIEHKFKIDNNRLINTSKSLVLKSSKEFDGHKTFGFKFYNKNDSRKKDSSQSFEYIEKINNKHNQILESSKFSRCTMTANDERSLTKKSTEIKPISREIFDAEKEFSFDCCNEKMLGIKHCKKSNEDIEKIKQLLEASRSLLFNSKSENSLDWNERLDFTIYNEDNTKFDSSKSLENIEKKMNSEENNQLLITSRSLKNTPINTCHKRLKKKVSKTQSEGEKNLFSDKNTSESSFNNPKLINNRQSFQPAEISHDNIFHSLNSSRSAESEATAMKNFRTKSSKETPELLVDTELFSNNSLRYNCCCEKNDEINRTYICEETEVPENEMKNECTECLENKFSSHIEKSFDITLENNDQSLVEPAKFLADLESEKVKNSQIEESKNYKRCGTYVIERATNSNNNSKHAASDESLEEKPTVKRRKTEQETIFNEFENSLISNKIPDDNTRRDLKGEGKKWILKTAKERKSTEAKMVSIERGFHEINEKYVNENFDYESDNTGDNNLTKYNDSSITVEENLSTSDVSIYDLHPKAISDSILPRETNSLISSLKAQKECVEGSTEVKKKLKKKMSLLRGRTDNLISSVEASAKEIDKKSSCKNETTPRVEEETIQEVDFTTIEKIVDSKTIGCSFLPKIPVDRINAKNADTKDNKFCHIDVETFWRKNRRNSSTRLINLDPPIFREIKIRNSRESKQVASLPPVAQVALRKERRRDSARDSRAVWNNYVRRRPDFNLVLTGRIGTFKDYDPFLLAERQMNDLLSDTCSDQSFTDSPVDHRKSSSPNSHNFPLSHSSAFVKYPNPVTRNLNNSDKRGSLIAPPSEFDDLTADFSSDSTETNSISREILADLEDSRVRENGISHESKSKDNRDHVLGRRVIIDKSKALGTTEIIDDSGRKNVQSNEKARKILEKITPKVVRPHVNRSSSVRANSAPKAPERKNNNSSLTTTNKMNSRSSPGSGLNNRNNNYASLNGSNMSLSSIVSSEAEVKRSNSLFDELASSFEDDASGIYPSLRSLLKNDSLSISSPVQSNRPRNGQMSDEELSSPESYQRHDHNKLSADSAYSSLNRKYSNHGRSTNDMAGRLLDEDSPQRRRDGDAGTTSSAKSSKMSKFCHECGCKFPETAKFCCECGIRRLTL